MENSNLHSAEYFGEQRDYWWNRDFLELMAKRWDLRTKRSVLDVGCGMGHWHKLLSPFLAADAVITGIDQEPVWVEKARSLQPATSQEFRFVVGDANKLPFADNSFDFVTCQTVLIHMSDPKKILSEWLRVLKPGGLLGVAEPNNIAATMVRSSRDFNNSIDTIVAKARFQMICERGKWKLGEGHNSIGDLLPGYFAECGAEKIQVYVADKPSPLIPPYSLPDERAAIEQSRDWDARDFSPWSAQDTERYFLAGGGDISEFAELRELWLEEAKKDLAEIDRGKLHSAGGGLVYLVSGYKPKM